MFRAVTGTGNRSRSRYRAALRQTAAASLPLRRGVIRNTGTTSGRRDADMIAGTWQAVRVRCCPRHARDVMR